MNKHFLVSISDDYNSLFGVKFLCSFFSSLSQHHLTLYHVCSNEKGQVSNSLTQMWDGPADKEKGRLTAAGKKALNASERLLNTSGMTVDKIITKTTAQRYGKVKDILTEGAQGNYDAVILGRRASYALQWLMERSSDETAQAMIKESTLSFPLWVCPEVKADRKHVLVCVDGSETSQRAVDHVGYILSSQKQHNVTIFHVKDSKGIDGGKVFAQAKSILNNHSIPDQRIQTESVSGLDASGKILSYATQRGFAAVALGINRHSGSSLKAAGKTTSKIIKKAEAVSVWCCP